MKTQYISRDGAAFKTHEEALAHEDILFNQWAFRATISVFEFVQSMSYDDKDEYYGTEFDLAYRLLRTYWNSLDDSEALV